MIGEPHMPQMYHEEQLIQEVVLEGRLFPNIQFQDLENQLDSWKMATIGEWHWILA